MQKIILLVEPNDDAFMTPAKIGNIFMNRFAIDEDASSEILKIFELAKTSMEISWEGTENYQNFSEERQQNGMDHFIVTTNNTYLYYLDKNDQIKILIWINGLKLIHLRKT